MKIKEKKYLLGFLHLAIAQFSIAVNFINGRELAGSVSVYTFLSFRFVLGALFLFSFMKIAKIPFINPVNKQKKLNLKQWLLISFQGLCGGVFFNALLFEGMKYTTATIGGIVASTFPALMAVYSYCFLREKIGPNKIIAIILSMFGIILLSYGATTISENIDLINSDSLYGMFLIFLAMTPEVLYTIIAKRMMPYVTPIGSSTYICLLNAIIALPFVLYGYLNDPNYINWSIRVWTVLLLGGFTTVGFYAFWPMGLKTVEATTAALVTGVMPIFTAILGFLYLNESFAIYDFLGMFFVVSSIVIGAGGARRFILFMNGNKKNK